MGAIYLFFKGPVIAKAPMAQATTRQAGRIEGPLISRAACALVTKFRVGEEGRYGLSACEIRSKEFLKNPRHC